MLHHYYVNKYFWQVKDLHFTSDVFFGCHFTVYLHFQTRKCMIVSDLSVNVSKSILTYVFQVIWISVCVWKRPPNFLVFQSYFAAGLWFGLWKQKQVRVFVPICVSWDFWGDPASENIGLLRQQDYHQKENPVVFCIFHLHMQSKLLLNDK